jgi:inorganic pyrophosphatase
VRRGGAGRDEQARPGSVDVFVEIPRNGRNKYECDQRRELLRLDRVLCGAIRYPTDDGFVLGTRAPDGDCLDALVVVGEPTFRAASSRPARSGRWRCATSAASTRSS